MQRVPYIVNLGITWSCRAMKKKNNIEVLGNMQMVDPNWIVGGETSNMNIIFLLVKDSKYW